MPTLYSTDRILVTHAGALPRPADLRPLVMAKSRGEAVDQAALDAKLRTSVAEAVKQQVKCGIDSVNDGELSKSNFTDYVRSRMAGFEMRPTDQRRRLEITARDRTKFGDYFESTANPRARLQQPGAAMQAVCTEKLRYIGHAELKRDLDNFKAALAGVKVAEAYLPANTPGTIEHWMANEHYKNDEEFVFAIADVMHEEYQAIVDAGF
ncbi:MAG TPA: hypothetical protein VKV32_10705, partial [Stellaceae bacterium]|nr:hypothetical protein [Stellaceae bacterium]